VGEDRHFLIPKTAARRRWQRHRRADGTDRLYDVIDQARNLTLTGTTNGTFASSLTDTQRHRIVDQQDSTSRWILAATAHTRHHDHFHRHAAGGNNGTTGSLGGGAVVTAPPDFPAPDALTVSHNISGTGTINQSGAGTQLGGVVAANTTNVNAGTLQVNGGLTTPTIAGYDTGCTRHAEEAAGATTTATRARRGQHRAGRQQRRAARNR
jgi:fibronectin-binding autotransporter adhesin